MMSAIHTGMGRWELLFFFFNSAESFLGEKLSLGLYTALAPSKLGHVDI